MKRRINNRVGLKVSLLLALLAGWLLPASAAVVDVMLVYDTTARAWAEGHGGMDLFSANTIAKMNLAMQNSGVDCTFRLAASKASAYVYSGDMEIDLDALQAGAGALSDVAAARNASGADLVALLVDTGSAFGWVGIGYVLQTYAGSPNYAFTVTSIRSVDVSHTLTHEIGHNLGCGHSKFQATQPGPNTALNTYSAGWYFTGSDGVKYHTIMAYNSDGYGNTYNPAPLFSTPLLLYKNRMAGEARDGDNARTIRQTMGAVAGYRSGGAFVHIGSTQYCYVYANAGTLSWTMIYDYTHNVRLAASAGFAAGSYNLPFQIAQPAQAVSYVYDAAAGRYVEALAYIYMALN